MFGVEPRCARKLSSVLFAVTLTAGTAGAVCTEVVALSPGETFAAEGAVSGESRCYRIDLDSPGVLMAVATPLEPGAAELALRFLEEGGAEAAEVLVAGRSPARTILRVRKPGALVFEVTSEDPGEVLGAHVFASRFVTDAPEVALKDGEDGEIDPILGPKDGEDGEIDPILVYGMCRYFVSLRGFEEVEKPQELTLAILRW